MPSVRFGDCTVESNNDLRRLDRFYGVEIVKEDETVEEEVGEDEGDVESGGGGKDNNSDDKIDVILCKNFCSCSSNS